MNLVERRSLLKRVLQFYSNNGLKETVKHFVKENEKPDTVRTMIRRHLKRGPNYLMKRRGPKRTVRTVENMRKVKKGLNNKNVSESSVASKLRISQMSVNRMKREMNIKTYKCQKVPKYKEEQAERAQKLCKKLYRKTLQKVIIIDDETWVYGDPEELPIQKRSLRRQIDSSRQCQI